MQRRITFYKCSTSIIRTFDCRCNHGRCISVAGARDATQQCVAYVGALRPLARRYTNPRALHAPPYNVDYSLTYAVLRTRSARVPTLLRRRYDRWMYVVVRPCILTLLNTVIMCHYVAHEWYRRYNCFVAQIVCRNKLHTHVCTMTYQREPQRHLLTHGRSQTNNERSST